MFLKQKFLGLKSAKQLSAVADLERLTIHIISDKILLTLGNNLFASTGHLESFMATSDNKTLTWDMMRSTSDINETGFDCILTDNWF